MSRAGRSRRPRAQGMGAAGPAAMGARRPPTVGRQSLQDFLGSRLGGGRGRSQGQLKSTWPKNRTQGLAFKERGFA